MADEISENPTQFSASINKLSDIFEKLPEALHIEPLTVLHEYLQGVLDEEKERQERDKQVAQAFARLQNRLKSQEETFLKATLAREEERKAHSKYIEEMALILQARLKEQGN